MMRSSLVMSCIGNFSKQKKNQNYERKVVIMNRLFNISCSILVTTLVLLGWSYNASATVYDQAVADKPSWNPLHNAPTDADNKSLAERLIRLPRQPKLLDERYDPILLVRTVFVSTAEDQHYETNADDKKVLVDSSKMDTSLYGHREGFVLENVEIGLKGRFNKYGLYYKAKFDLVPKEKNGNRSSDYLKDAYLGWDYYSVFDIRVGRMKLPFSQANMTSTSKRNLVYAPNLNTLIPKRQIGGLIAISDPWQIATLTGGIFNSAKQSIQQMSSLQQLMYVGRFDLDVGNILKVANANFMNFNFKLGANIAFTKQNYDPPTKHRWIGFDAKLSLYIFTVTGEYLIKDYYLEGVTPDDLLANRAYGWHADLTVHAWPGVIDFTARIEESDGDDADEVHGFNPTFPMDEVVKQKKRWISFGTTVHFTKWSKMSLNYIIREELEGYNLENDVILGMIQIDI